MRELRSEIEIGASAVRIWEVLTEFDRYPDWNPFIRRVKGQPERGRRLEVHLKPPGGRGITLRPRVLQADPPYVLRWLGRLGIPGLFDGEHVFEIDSLSSGRCRFIQRERFRGVLVPLAGPVLQDASKGFAAMNRALKTRCEAGFGRPVEPDALEPSP